MARLATEQHGVLAQGQLIGLGVPRRTIERWVACGRLHPLHREVYAVGHTQVSRRGRCWAAILAYGPGALLSHGTAAALWGLAPARGSVVHVTAPAGRQGVCRREGIWIHRCKLTTEDRVLHEGLPVTSVARTLFDLAEVVDFPSLQRAAEDADRLRLSWAVEMGAVCERGRGRRALRPARRLLAELRSPDEGRSPLENRFLAFCRRHGIRAPEANVHVLGHEVDALWPGARLVVELDSWEHHGHRAAFERDRARDPELLLAGYRTIRITRRRITRAGAELAEQLRTLLALRERP